MMISNQERYRIWAPERALWTDWAKPTLFAGSADTGKFNKEDIPEIKWINIEKGIAVIVDLPGKDGVCEGLGLAAAGFRGELRGPESRRRCAEELATRRAA